MNIDVAPNSELRTLNRCYNGAGGGTRTRDPDLGKVVLYQLSYTRVLLNRGNITKCYIVVNRKEFIVKYGSKTSYIDSVLPEWYFIIPSGK